MQNYKSTKYKFTLNKWAGAEGERIAHAQQPCFSRYPALPSWTVHFFEPIQFYKIQIQIQNTKIQMRNKSALRMPSSVVVTPPTLLLVDGALFWTDSNTRIQIQEFNYKNSNTWIQILNTEIQIRNKSALCMPSSLRGSRTYLNGFISYLFVLLLYLSLLSACQIFKIQQSKMQKVRDTHHIHTFYSLYWTLNFLDGFNPPLFFHFCVWGCFPPVLRA